MEQVSRRPSSGAAEADQGGSDFVGRQRELEELRAGLDAAFAGRGRIFLLAGEAGIGKTRLAAEVAAVAAGRGALVSWGRCWEAGGAPVYWPWVQAMRGVLEADGSDASPDATTGLSAIQHLAAPLSDLLQLHTHGAAWATKPGTDPDVERFRLFDATATFFKRVARDRPLVIVLDDLHVADTPSLLLLQFVASSIANARILLVAAYRDTDLDHGHPLLVGLAELVRQPATRALSLSGLGQDAVARFIQTAASIAPTPELVAQVRHDTDGNPLFITEVIRLLVAEGMPEHDLQGMVRRPRVPSGLRAVIGRRLGRLPTATRQILGVASVLGREFDLKLLARLTGTPAASLLDRLADALTAKIVSEVLDAPGRLRFSHALVRDVMYEELPPARRLQLHHEAGEAIMAHHADELDSHLTELAHHFVLAAPVGDVERGVEYSRAAGHRAMRLVAYEEAGRLYRLAHETLALDEAHDPRLACDLLLELGEAQARSGDGLGARETFLRAASAARRLGSAEMLARAAIGYGGRFLWARAGSDPHLVPLLEEALEALGGRESPERVRVMSRLAGALRDQHDRAPRDRLTREAVEMARRLGDPATLAFALDARIFAVFWPENPHERMGLANELAQLADRNGDRERAMSARFVLGIGIPLELGDLDRVRAELESVSRLTEELHQPAYRWMLEATRASVALLDGRFDDGRRLMDRALAYGRRAQATDAVLSHRIQLFTLHMHLGGLGEVEAMVRQSIADYPARPLFRCFLAYLLVELGRDAEARALFDELTTDRAMGLPKTNEWLLSLGFLADVAFVLRAAETATEISQQLLPYASRNASTPDYIATGSVSRPLGVAAAAAGRWSEAERHLGDALRLNRQMGARPWEARTLCDWAAMLLLRGGPGDAERATQMLAEAADVAGSLRMLPLQERIERLSTGLSPVHPVPISSQAPPLPSIFRREGDYWAVAYAGEAFRLKDAVGLRYLSRLLLSPGREFHVLDLVAMDRGSGVRRGSADHRMRGDGSSAGAELLDDAAKAAYQRRLRELEDETDEARQLGDADRAARAEAERDFLVRELTAAYGLQGRPRRSSSPSERARVSVTRAIRSALARIREHGPVLGEHLERTIHTGTFCSYTPEPLAPVSWDD